MEYLTLTFDPERKKIDGSTHEGIYEVYSPRRQNTITQSK